MASSGAIERRVVGKLPERINEEKASYSFAGKSDILGLREELVPHFAFHCQLLCSLHVCTLSQR